MIEMTEQEAIARFEKIHYLYEKEDMKRDIDSIRFILSQNPIEIPQVRAQINTVNAKHPENIIIYNLIFPPQGIRISLGSASDDNLISDLRWKLEYLQAKCIGKVFEEFYKEMQKMQNGQQ